MKAFLFNFVIMICCTSLAAQDRVKTPLEQVMTIVSAPDFGEKIKQHIAAMQTDFESIKGTFTGSVGSPGFMSGSPGEQKWESAILFSGVKKKGIIKSIHTTENKEVMKGFFQDVAVKEVFCFYKLLVDAPANADYSMIVQGLAEVIHQNMPGTDMSQWKFNEGKTEATFTIQAEKIAYVIRISVLCFDTCNLDLSFIVKHY